MHYKSFGTINFLSRVSIFFVGFFLLLHTVSIGRQTGGQNETNDDYVPLEWYAYDATSSVYENIISISLENVSFEEALSKIAQKGKVRLSYNRINLPKYRLNFAISNKTIIEAFQKVLAGTELVVLASPSGQLIIKKRNSAKAKMQTGTIRGIVTNAETGEPMPGASVFIEGTTIGAAADTDGEYSIANVETGTYMLIAQFIGYQEMEKEVTVTEDATITVNFELVPQTSSLEELVVVGYGSMQQEDLTGSVSTISSDDIEHLSPTISIDQALQGQAAGVHVVTETGQPGSASRVRIRGTTSLLGSNQPLFVIDGIPMEPSSNIPDDGSSLNTDLLQAGINTPLANINPNNIASISILKGASAAAIYGSRAANGVVIIQTKSGSYQAETRFSAGYSLSTQEAITTDVLNAQQFREIYTEAAENSTSNTTFIQSILDGSYFGEANTNWEEVVSPGNPITSDFNFSVTGGSEQIRYYSSFGLLNQQGTFTNSTFDRYSAALNLDSKLTDRLNFSTRLKFSYSDQVSPDDGLMSRIYDFRPDLPVFDEDGNYTYSEYYGSENPAALATANNENRTSLFLGSVFGTYEFIDGLLLKSQLSLIYNKGDFSALYPSVTFLGGWSRFDGPGLGYAQRSSSTDLSHIWENTLTYNTLLGREHHLTALVGASWQGNRYKYFQASGRGFPKDKILTNLSSATEDFTIGSNETQSGLVSYFSRLKYDYDDRYLLTLSGRVDGSSKFAEDNEWAFLPAVAGAWRISNEEFFNADFIDALKVRAGYGYTGQHDFGPYEARTLFISNRYGGEAAVIQNQLGNRRLRWETTRQLDIGLDFVLFNGRLSGAIDYYEKKTEDLLYFYKVPGNTGYSTVIANIGATRNRGVELVLRSNIIQSNDFRWDLSLNISRNENVLVSLNDDFQQQGTQIILPPNTGSVLKIGAPIGLLYGYVSEGVFQSQAEIDALNTEAPDGVYQDPLTAPGDLKFEDISGPNGVPDGKITDADRTVIGNSQPDFYGGFTSSWTYKGFNLSMLFTYVFGSDLFWDAQRVGANFGSTFFAENKIAGVMNRWTPENPTNQPRVVMYDPNNNDRRSSYYIYDASYVRLKNVQFSYTLPGTALSELGFFRSVMIYATAQNLLTITDYPGADPETSNLFNDDVSSGLDNSRYPRPRVYTIGIQIDF